MLRDWWTRYTTETTERLQAFDLLNAFGWFSLGSIWILAAQNIVSWWWYVGMFIALVVLESIGQSRLENV